MGSMYVETECENSNVGAKKLNCISQFEIIGKFDFRYKDKVLDKGFSLEFTYNQFFFVKIDQFIIFMHFFLYTISSIRLYKKLFSAIWHDEWLIWISKMNSK